MADGGHRMAEKAGGSEQQSAGRKNRFKSKTIFTTEDTEITEITERSKEFVVYSKPKHEDLSPR